MRTESHAEISAERDRLKKERDYWERARNEWAKSCDIVQEENKRLRAALKIAEGALNPVVSYLDANNTLIHTLKVCIAEISHQQSRGIFPVRIVEENAAWNAADKERWAKLKELEDDTGNARSALAAIQEVLKP